MDKIAIIGLSCLFPGADTPDEFWQTLATGQRTTSPTTAAQFGVDPAWFYDSQRQKPDTTYFLHGGYIKQYSGDFPRAYDLQSKWALEVARSALKDSGYLEHNILNSAGLVLGSLNFPTRHSSIAFTSDLFGVMNKAIIDLLGDKSLVNDEFLPPLWDHLDEQNYQHPLATEGKYGLFSSGGTAAVVAAQFGLGRTAFALDAACSSSLYAVALACHYLNTGRTDLMLAGAVSAADPLFVNMGFAHLGGYPRSGQPRGSRPLDSSSDGLIAGEGAGMFVLKRHADALRDNDKVYALISGFGLSNDGRGKHILTPNSKGQIAAFQRAYASAGITAEQVDYVECHASGTTVGDKTELHSMEQFFAGGNVPRIGSVKSNVGHLLTAAGMASMTKLILSMVHGVIPPTIGVEHPMHSPEYIFSAEQIVTEPIAWQKQNGHPRRAGINAFGFGGVSSHLILEEPTDQQSTVNNQNTPQNNPVRMAITGMDAHFGPLNGLDRYAQAIYDGEAAFIPLPENRWKGLQHQHLPGLDQTPIGAYIESFDIDFMKYRIPPNPADEPIPQQLLLLKVGDNAIRDAGLSEGSNVAVIVALGTELSLHQYRARADLTWQIRQALDNAQVQMTEEQASELERIAKDSLLSPAEVNHYTSYIGNITANRVSALWDFSGPSFTISSEENSVFKALEVAQMMLERSEVDAVVLGAVDLAGGVESVLMRSTLNPLHRGESAAGIDEKSTGWMVGEGAGAIVLKRADQAQTDATYATIESIAIVQDNTQAGGFPGTPSAGAITSAANQALARANINPAQVGYVEFHSSGVQKEDVAEVSGLTRVYRGDDLITAFGTAKANIGHTFAASGMAAIIRAALATSLRFIPAIPNWNTPEQPDAWNGTSLWAAAKSRTWFDDTRIAAVSGLGVDGGASHVILSSSNTHAIENSLLNRKTYLQSAPPYLFPIAGNNINELLSGLDDLASEIGRVPLDLLADRVFADYQTRQNAPHTAALVGKNADELRKQIDTARQGIPQAVRDGKDWSTPAGSTFSPNPAGSKGRVAFVYPGAFNAYPKLGYELLQLFPNTYESLQQVKYDVGGAVAERLLYPRTLEKPGVRVTRQMKDALTENTPSIIESGLSFALLYTRVMRDYFDVHPASAFGYSLGEGSMMWGMGVWRDGDMGSERLHSTHLFHDRLVGKMNTVRDAWGLSAEQENIWVAYFISAPAATVQAAADRESKVFVTHINTPNEVMIAGDPTACERVLAQVSGESMKAPFSMVIHNDVMLSEYNEYVRIHDFPVHPDNNVTFYSAADYGPLVLEQKAIAHSISRMVSKPIDFQRLVERAYADGARVFIELGPRSTCARWIDDTLGEREHLAVSIDNLGVDVKTSIIRMLAQLVAHRLPVDLSNLYAPLPQQNGKSLIRTVTLGGEDIYAAIANDENRAKLGITELVRATANTQSSQPMSISAKPVYHTAMPEGITSVHTDFLRSRQEALRQMGEMIQTQIAQIGTTISEAPTPVSPALTESVPTLPPPPVPNPAPAPSKVQGITPLYPDERVLDFAIGRVADAFGDKYTLYDNRRAPRIPNGDLLLVSRFLDIQGERFVSKPGTSIHAEYDVPENIWFYRDNPYPVMPYSVYMEIALQPCGFLSAHHGPTLAYPEIDFYFRNLDGSGTLYHDLDMRGRTITNHVTLTKNTILSGTIIQSFTFAMYDGDTLFYEGDATFGYFTLQALNSQAGLDKGNLIPHWLDTVNLDPSQIEIIDPKLEHGKGYMKLGHGQLEFTSEIKVVKDGGKYGQGYAYANTRIDPSAWFFKAHFYQDPVMPGSIGVETILQAMQAYAISAGLGDEFKAPRFKQADGGHKCVWKYRGQILSDSEKSHVEANIKRIERKGGEIIIYADASLWRDQLRIYEVTDLALAIVDAG